MNKERFKLIGIVIVVLLTVIVVFQNNSPVEPEILFFKRSMSLSALLFGTLAIGFVIGIVLGNRLSKRKKP